MPHPPISPSRAAPPGAERRVSRKLQKKRHEDTIDLPERLRDSDESSGEEESSQGPPLSMNMNQSIFGLIAAAGSRVDFNDRFDETSSEDEDGTAHHDKHHKGKYPRNEDLSKTSILQPKRGDKKSSSHRRKVSAHKLLKSLPSLPKLKYKSKSAPTKLADHSEEVDDPGETSDLSGPPAIQLTREASNRLPPVMSRMLEARAEMSSRPSFDIEGPEARTSGLESDVTPLARRLMDIFEFDEPERVIDEYPCWLLQSVLLQGFLYITAKHICFYAYLPKKAVSFLSTP